MNVQRTYVRAGPMSRALRDLSIRCSSSNWARVSMGIVILDSCENVRIENSEPTTEAHLKKSLRSLKLSGPQKVQRDGPLEGSNRIFRIKQFRIRRQLRRKSLANQSYRYLNPLTSCSTHLVKCFTKPRSSRIYLLLFFVNLFLLPFYRL